MGVWAVKAWGAQWVDGWSESAVWHRVMNHVCLLGCTLHKHPAILYVNPHQKHLACVLNSFASSRFLCSLNFCLFRITLEITQDFLLLSQEWL